MIPAYLLLARYFTVLLATAPPVSPWNSLAAENEAMGVLIQRGEQANNPFCKTPNCSVQHEVLGAYELPSKKAHLLIAASKDPQHKCAECGVALSFLEFTVSRQLWRLTHSDFAVSEWGQNGEPFDGGITVDELGSDAPRIFVERGSTEKGGSPRTTDIYARGDAGFRLVSSIPAGTVTAPAVRWDSVSARHEVLRALQAQANKPSDPICEIEAPGYPGATPEPGYKCSFEHQVLGDSDLPYKSGRRKLVLAGSRDPVHNCDDCGVALSFFEFSQGPRGWELTHADFGAGEWGHDGKPTLETMRVETLGEDVPCVYVLRSQMHQGIRTVSTDIYARLETGFLNVASIDAEYSAISVDTRPPRMHDLLVKSWTERGRLRSVNRYHFDGTEYKLVPAADVVKKRPAR